METLAMEYIGYHEGNEGPSRKHILSKETGLT